MSPEQQDSTLRSAATRWVAALALFCGWMIAITVAFPPSSDLIVEVDLASDTAGQMQLFVDAGRGFHEELSTRSPVLGDGAVHRHRLVLPSPSLLYGLRLDPIDRRANLSLDRIEISFGNHHFRFLDESLGAWKPAGELREKDADHSHHFVSLGIDPQLLLEGPESPFASSWQRFAALPDGRRLALMLLVIPLLLLALRGEGNGLGKVSESLLALSTPLGLLLVHGLRTLQDWWLLDDPCLLVSTLRHGPWAHFFDPQVWRPLSGNVLMPWTPLSFAFDAHFFGPEPQAFYVHQLAALALLLVVVYALLRPALSALGASLALSLFITSTPAVAVAWRLMNRHYLEGTLLALLALALYWRGVEREYFHFALAGAVFYLLATTAKEVFVPLVVLLLLVPVGSFRLRLRFALPFAVAGGLYALWRFYMLGVVNSVSGYAESGPGSSIGHLLKAPRLLGITEPWQILLISFVPLAVLVAIGRKSRSYLIFSLGTLVVLALPLLPVVDRLAPRHFFLPTLALTTALATAVRPWLSRYPLPTTAGALALLFFGLQALEGSPIWLHREESVSQYRGEGEFMLQASPDETLFTDLVNVSYLSCLGELRELLGQGTSPGFCGDACWCTNTLPEAEARRYEEGLIVPFEPPLHSTCASPRALSVEMRYDAESSRLSWRLGPYSSGSYQIMMVHGEEPPKVSVPVPIGLEGSTPWALARPLRWIIKYRSEAGWETFSPVLEIDEGSTSCSWNRLDSDAEE